MAPVLLRDTLLSYREPQWSGSLQFDGRARTGAVAHRWVAGVDMLSKSISLVNDASQRAAARIPRSGLTSGLV